MVCIPSDLDYLIKHYGNGRGQPKPDEVENNQFWAQFAEASLMPPLVMKYVFKVIPTQAPFFVRPIVNMISGKTQQSFTDPDIKTKINFAASELNKRGSNGQAWFAGGDSAGGPTAADFQMIFPLETATTSRLDPSLVPESLRQWVKMVHDRPAYQRALEKGGPYDYAKL